MSPREPLLVKRPLGQTAGTFDIGLPAVRGAGGGRNLLASGFGGAGTGGEVEIVYTGAEVGAGKLIFSRGIEACERKVTDTGEEKRLTI